MRTIKAETLSLEAYAPFGAYADLAHPEGEYMGEFPVRFYRDMVPVHIGGEITSFSVVYTKKRKMIPEDAEYHSAGTEVLIPLNDDVVIYVAPATGGEFPYGKERAFIIPWGTMVTIRPGVWHKAPFPVHKETVATIVVLPEREYALDCTVLDITNPFEIVCP